MRRRARRRRRSGRRRIGMESQTGSIPGTPRCLDIDRSRHPHRRSRYRRQHRCIGLHSARPGSGCSPPDIARSGSTRRIGRRHHQSHRHRRGRVQAQRVSGISWGGRSVVMRSNANRSALDGTRGVTRPRIAAAIGVDSAGQPLRFEDLHGSTPPDDPDREDPFRPRHCAA